MDTVERVRENKRRYILIMMDDCSALTFAVAQALLDELAGLSPWQLLYDNNSYIITPSAKGIGPIQELDAAS